MYQREITPREAGQRLDRYLYKLLPEAGSGFLHKMLRKKNITLNGQKAEGRETLEAGDQVTIFFAQETLCRFMGYGNALEAYRQAYLSCPEVKVLYENDHILLADKPAGLLTQKAAKTDISLNEWLIGYLLEREEITADDLAVCRPSVCNRLDRNTSGIVLCAKSNQGAQLFARLLQERTLHKYYQLYVKGTLREAQLIEGYLVKDKRRNKVSVQSGAFAGRDAAAGKNAGQKAADRQGTPAKEAYIQTSYRPIKQEADKTLLEVELITGKPHQIRAHLASIGHPLLGDYKYGDKSWNDSYQKSCRISAQLLHACKVTFPQLEAPFEDISGQTFCSALPEAFARASLKAL